MKKPPGPEIGWAAVTVPVRSAAAPAHLSVESVADGRAVTAICLGHDGYGGLAARHAPLRFERGVSPKHFRLPKVERVFRSLSTVRHIEHSLQQYLSDTYPIAAHISFKLSKPHRYSD